MANAEYIIDNGLFIGRSDFNSTLSESFETISNLFKTIKEYRDYSQPSSPEWEEYVREIFHILGFHTEKQAPRIFSLKDIGSNGNPCALVGFIQPVENFDEIAPGLDWLSYLYYVAHFHSVEWGVLTNGLQLKVVNFNREDYQKVNFWSNIDSVIENNQSDSFLTIYKVFSIIRGRKNETIKPEIVKKPPKKGVSLSKEYDLYHHTDGMSQQTIDIYKALRSKIMSLSDTVIEKYHKLYVGYSRNNNFCEIRLLKEQLIIWVDISVNDLVDPLSICRDVRKIGHYGTGNTEIRIQDKDSIDYAFNIINQSFEKDRQVLNHKREQKSNEGDNPRSAFWKQLIDKAKDQGLIKGNKSQNAFNWISIPSGKSGLTYDCVLRKNDADVQLYINKGDAELNKSIFSNLYQHKEEIEEVFGSHLEWQRLDTKRASRIRFVISDYGFDDMEHWSELQDKIINSAIRLQKALQNFINQFN